MTAVDVDIRVMQDVVTGAVNYQGVVDPKMARKEGKQRREELIEAARNAPVFLANGLDVSKVDPDFKRHLPLPYEDGMWVVYTMDVPAHGADEYLGSIIKERPESTCQLAVYLRRWTVGKEVRVSTDAVVFDPIDPLGAQTMLCAMHFEYWTHPNFLGKWKTDYEINIDVSHVSKENYVGLMDHWYGVCNRYMLYALAVVTVINTPRVRVEPAALPKRLAKEFVRKSKRAVSYKVLVLPDGTRTNGWGAYGQGIQEVALHSVRGHFATYTEASPLFGKYTGTYWKGSHIRGRQEHGEINKDYKVLSNEGGDK